MSQVTEINQTAVFEAVTQSYAVIQFLPDGTIETANELFLEAMGYSLDEITGQHHSIFCEESYVKSNAYKIFWDKLGRGQAQIGEFKRITKDGSEIYLSASYFPYKGEDGKVERVVKVARDITEMKRFAMMKQMIDLAPINIMLSDPHGTLLYMNDSSSKTLKTLETYLPDRVENLIGKSIDMFHKKPEHQRGI